MRVYVATRFEDWHVAKDAARLITDAGHACTSRWIGVARQIFCGNGGHKDDPVRRRVEAHNDLEDCSSSDALLLLATRSGGCGMWTELGYFLAMQEHQLGTGSDPIRILCTGPARERCVFAELRDRVEVYGSVEQAVAAL